MCGETVPICCCSLPRTNRTLELLIKNGVRALWGSPLCGGFASNVAEPCYLPFKMRVLFLRGFLGRHFFHFFEFVHFCDFASLWCILHSRPLEHWFLRWFVQVEFWRASVTVRHYGVFCTGGLSSIGFCGGSCRLRWGGA